MHANPEPQDIPDEGTLYDLSPEMRELHQLHSVFVEVGMNKKYFAKRLSKSQSLNRWIDIILVGLTVIILLISNEVINQENVFWLPIAISALSGVALIISMSRHYFRTTKSVEQFSKLHQEYTSLYSRLRDLEDELWIEEKLTPCMKKELTRCKERITNIAT
ncbi:MAG: hypothetical protein KC994_26655, partial [Candidatus Omnitrophica bacterium]|nr:hypothetical protein [Candidatus Omnitrophota bacterium]